MATASCFVNTEQYTNQDHFRLFLRIDLANGISRMRVRIPSAGSHLLRFQSRGAPATLLACLICG